MVEVNEVKEAIKPKIEEAGYFLDDVLYEKEGRTYYLRVIVDKNGVMTIEDCVTVTNIVNPIIDNMNIIDDSYVLDVCSKEKGCE